MGVEQSIELARPFADIAKWPKSRLDSVITHYLDGEYDFGVDCGVVMNITGYEIDDAKELVNAHSKNESGIINAITLMVSVICLGNSENRNEAIRLERLFDLMDFNGAGKISSDELTILLLCIGQAFTFIMEGKVSDEKAQAYETNVLQFSKHLLGTMNKRAGSTFVKKEEFLTGVRDLYFNNGVVLVNDLFQAFVQNPFSTGEGESKK